MNPAEKSHTESALAGLFCHLAAWFGPMFAVPLFIALNNTEDVVIPLPTLALLASATWLAAGLLGWRLAALAGPRFEWWLNRMLLAAALVTALQSNVVHDLFYYGAFNGERFDLRAHGWKFWAEWIGWLAAFPLATWGLAKVKRLPAWLFALPVLSFVLLLAPALQANRAGAAANASAEIDPGVFTFSSVRNLVHLLPDGFQGDVVRQVFDEHPELAARFEGFTLFTDHVGMYQGTAPSLHTILTGQPFPLERGFSYDWARPEIRAQSYQKSLLDQGWRVDYVPISGWICVDGADSCEVRPFNDMKARGYYRHRTEDALYSARLIADLSMFRLTPMYLKEKIHNEGRWLLADTTLDGSSPWPDPVIHEWTDRLRVIDDRPVYKWYHYIGTHIPAKWDADCGQLEAPAKERQDYLGQAYCVLNNLAGLLDRMKTEGIYDQTAFIISGDHGFNITPDDSPSPPLNAGMYRGLAGSGRPTLLVKQVGSREPLGFSSLPTYLVDVAPTALELAGIDSPQRTAFEAPKVSDRIRWFRHYSIPNFWTGNPIPYVEYAVGQPASEGSEWPMSDIRDYGEAPSAYEPLNRSTGQGFVYGADLREEPTRNESSWVVGRQLAFVVGLGGAPRERRLELTLHIPEWLDGQAFTVQLNGGSPWHSGPLESQSEPYWRRIAIPLDLRVQAEGRNFVSVVFEKLLPPPDTDTWRGAAIVESIRVVDGGIAAADQARAHQ